MMKSSRIPASPRFLPYPRFCGFLPRPRFHRTCAKKLRKIYFFLSISFLCQVQRSLSKVTAETFLSAWKGQVTPGGSKTRVRGKGAPDRLSAQHFLQDINHAMQSAGKRLRDFGSDQDVLSAGSALKKPRTLVVCSDQESVQVSAMNFARHHCRLFVEHIKDPGHRSWNDIWSALADSHLAKTAMVMLNLYNAKYGPWNKSGWFAKVQETAETLSKNIGPNDPLLRMFMPGILADSRRDASENCEEERRKFLDSLPNLECVRSKGPKASQSRFFSIAHAHQWLDRMWSSQGFLFAACCLLQGWASHADELWSPSGSAQDTAVRNKVNASPSSSSAAPKCKDDGRKPVLSRKKAREAAVEDLAHLRSRSKNSLHMLTKLMLDPDIKAVARIVAYVAEAETLAAGMMFKELRSAEQTVKYYAGWAHWSWLSTARDTISVLRNLEQLSLIGFDVQLSGEASPDALITEDAMASTMWSFMANLLRRRAGSNLFYTCGGGATAGLLHEEESKVQGSLAYFREAYKTIQVVQDHGSLQAKAALRGHCYTSEVLQWVFKALASTEFLAVPSVLKEYLHEFWSCLLNSKIIEDGNKLQREEECRSNNSKSVSEEQGWYLLTQHSLLKKYHREEVSNKRLKHVPAGFSLAEVFQHKKPRQMSEEQQLDWDLVKNITGKLDWPTHTPETEQQRWADFALLQRVAASGRWQDMEDAWYTGLLPEGAVVLMQGHPLYVVRTYKHAALVWPLTWADERSVCFDLVAASLAWIHLFNADAQVCSIHPRCPRAMSKTTLANQGIVLQAGVQTPLLEWQASRGFEGVKEPVLRKLSCALGFGDVTWDTDDGDAEVALSVHMMLHLDPTLTQVEVTERMLKRCAGHREVANVQEEDMVDAVVDCLLPSEQRKVMGDIAEETEKMNKTAKLISKCAAKYQAALAALPKDHFKSGQEQRKAKEKEQTKQAKEAASANAKERARVYAERNMDVDQALKLSLPRSARAWADDRNGRWRLTWMPTGSQKSISWTACGHGVAAAACLKQGWAWSELYGRESMPADVAKIVKKLES